MGIGIGTAWYERVLVAFGVRDLEKFETPKGLLIRCPAHDDRTPSLHLNLGKGRDRVMVHCFAGCRTSDVAKAVGLTMNDLFEPKDDRDYAEQPTKRVESQHIYRYENGLIAYRVIRWRWSDGKKSFHQDRPKVSNPSLDRDNKTDWLPGLNGVRRVLYRLPELLADPGRTAWVFEGETKADRVAALGLPATCNVGGTGMGWRPEYSQPLVGRNVAVFPDNDTAGIEHAYRVTGSLIAHGAAGVRIVRLPGLPEKGDVVDWLDAGHTVADLIREVRSTPEWKPRLGREWVY